MATIYIFQSRYSCPKCHTYKTKRVNQSRDKSIQYRICLKCGEPFQKEAIKQGYEIDPKDENNEQKIT